MKQMKKMMALIVAMMLVVAMGVTAFGASITINKTPASGTTPDGNVTTEYHYYEFLKASIGSGTAVSYYLPAANTTLKDALAAVRYTKDGQTIAPFSFTKSADNSRWNAIISEDVNDSDGELIAAELAKITNNALANDTFSMTSSGTASATNLDPGYYLVTSSLGSKLVVQTLNDVEINTKNEYFTDVKTASKTNMNVGDTVTYTITVHVPATATIGNKITVHDTLDNHLALVAAPTTATCEGNTVNLSDGTPKSGTTETFTKEFTVTAGMLDKDVIITYDATLLSTAADDTGYVNTTYANDSAYETVPSKVRVWTFDFDLDKNFQDVTGDDAANYSATFELIKPAASGTSGTTYKFTQSGTQYILNNASGSSTITVNGKDNVNILGLEAGTYQLIEKTTADGYNLLTDPIIVTIEDTSPSGTDVDENKTPSHTVTYSIGGSGSSSGTVTVDNNKGTILPSTGGIGTTIFYVVGAILVMGAGILLITRRRVNAN